MIQEAGTRSARRWRSEQTAAADPETPEDWSALMARAQDGDRDAYRRLLCEIIPYVRCLAGRHFREPCDTEDTVQDVLLAIHTARRTYDPERPFGPWLTTIARRRIVDRMRRRGRRRDGHAAYAADMETFALAAANWHEPICDPRRVRDAVECLPPRQRTAIELLKLREMSLLEASQTTGMSVASLKAATHRGLASLRKLLVAQAEET